MDFNNIEVTEKMVYDEAIKTLALVNENLSRLENENIEYNNKIISNTEEISDALNFRKRLFEIITNYKGEN